MAWPLPDPVTLAEQAAGEFDIAFPDSDPRAPEGVMTVICRVLGMSLYEAYLYQRALADELMPDTAIELLERHADVWGVPRVPASPAGGPVTFAAASDVTVPVGVELKTPGGISFFTQAAVAVAGGGSGPTTVLAATAGAAGNLAAGTLLALVSPLAGLAVQGATVGAGGLVDPVGRDRETDDALRARLLAQIRARPRGGMAADYVAWARTVAGVAAVKVVPGWVGAGTVGVIVAMDSVEITPSPAEVAAIEAAIEVNRPVTAEVFVVPAEVVLYPFEIDILPNNAQVQASVTQAIDLFLARMEIGEPMYASRLSEAISSAGGEYAHRMPDFYIEQPPNAVARAETYTFFTYVPP